MGRSAKVSVRTSRAKERPPASIAFSGRARRLQRKAARKLLGPGVSVLPCERFEDIFRGVKEGRRRRSGGAHREYAGRVGARELRPSGEFSSLPIVAETQYPHRAQSDRSKRRAIFRDKESILHPVALNQCLNFFARNPRIERIPSTTPPAASR